MRYRLTNGRGCPARSCSLIRFALSTAHGFLHAITRLAASSKPHADKILLINIVLEIVTNFKKVAFIEKQVRRLVIHERRRSVANDEVPHKICKEVRKKKDFLGGSYFVVDFGPTRLEVDARRDPVRITRRSREIRMIASSARNVLSVSPLPPPPFLTGKRAKSIFCRELRNWSSEDPFGLSNIC
ncbi:hypothetical protein PUN28_013191 [Cardiocondyla obscurior]|uniref:Uncharacterized protein n=1 Tax=Cardiocondyla obscurior TaxID=286306 RepID=A0AAW2FA51_9HYME